MSIREEIIKQALALPLEDREYIVAALKASLSAAAIAVFNDARFQQEMARRFADPTDTIPWSQVRDEL